VEGGELGSLSIEPKVTSMQRSSGVKVHVALGAFLVMIAAPVVASSDERAMPLLVDASSVFSLVGEKKPHRAPVRIQPMVEAPELTISIDCDGSSCAVSSGLVVEVISAPRSPAPLP
jgi:hypothetical protein